MWLAIAAPAVGPKPDIIFNTPGGSPAYKKDYKSGMKIYFIVKINSTKNNAFILIYKQDWWMYQTSWNSFATYKADNGVCSAVFRTTVLPHANAGPTFQANMRRGKFHGMIWPATPIGSCNVCTWYGPSAGTVSPWILSAQPGVNMKIQVWV